MNKKRLKQLNESETSLLDVTTRDLIPALIAAPSLVHVKQAAFDYYNADTKEHFQVQVVVTRNKEDFLEFLQIEEMSNYTP